MRHAFVPMLLIALAACALAPPTHAEGAVAPAARTAPAQPTAAPPATAHAGARVAAPAVDSPPVAEDPAARDGVARMDRFGALRLRMTAAQAQAAWDGNLRGDTPTADDGADPAPACSESRGNFALMFEGGRFVRCDVGKPRERAPGGGRMRMSRAQIEAAYPGRVQVQWHDHGAGGRYLRLADPGLRHRAMLFETDARGQVTRWRVGLEPQVDYTEGRS